MELVVLNKTLHDLELDQVDVHDNLYICRLARENEAKLKASSKISTLLGRDDTSNF